ncbi:aminoacyl-tRNA hydrolase [candidate division Kazan bacterium RIFCSPHIGHO2_01_FULL_49_10]|uniref:Peptidyl-tRNA hydrolase n=1 Tax=candidate division Kazan bacterium RIFCSPLOWO2_01_FULL_48_13 TaxID=1798539 RepID=A0A1F4PPM2_UNCK3|nr:MAG: aminoacyl-tRNA hydrolase [candidate division Kazan bacterium RIFCSPHIGHO2_01_FULL_49_10]OGB85569.1 MAG: aminoacyl-tRNA hydrolase [candidate division Kazan bacterium RIFCSPLOWO2_01_FULL_48_13]
MKLVVGLGNPGKKYERTRHNVGFMVVDALAKELGLMLKKNDQFQAVGGATDKIALAKPQTFMNNSGISVKTISKKYRVKPEDILIVADDIDMDLGKLRYREIGSSGGHKGVQSVIDNLKTNIFPRLKVGISRSEKLEPNEYVTANFTNTQLSQVKKILPVAVRTIKEKFLKI